REAQTDEGRDRLAEWARESDDEVHLPNSLRSRLRHRRELRMNRVISFDDPDRSHELGPFEARQGMHEPDIHLSKDRRMEGDVGEDGGGCMAWTHVDRLSA